MKAITVEDLKSLGWSRKECEEVHSPVGSETSGNPLWNHGSVYR